MTTSLLGVGESITISFMWEDEDGAPITVLSPAPTLAVTDPAGTVTTPALTQRGATAFWDYVASPDTEGTWLYQGRCLDTDCAVEYTEVVSLWVSETSLGDELDTLLSAVAGNVTSVAPVAPDTLNLTIVRGDDYTTSSGRTLPEWTSDGWSVLDLSAAASVTFKAKTRLGTTIFTKAMNILSDTQVRLQLTDAETAVFDVGVNAYRYDLEAILSVAKGSDVVTLARGQMTVLEDIRA